jgi:hypothetical protein
VIFQEMVFIVTGVRTSKPTHRVYITELKRLMTFRNTIAVFFVRIIRNKRINGHNSEILWLSQVVDMVTILKSDHKVLLPLVKMIYWLLSYSIFAK